MPSIVRSRSKKDVARMRRQTGFVITSAFAILAAAVFVLRAVAHTPGVAAVPFSFLAVAAIFLGMWAFTMTITLGLMGLTVPVSDAPIPILRVDSLAPLEIRCGENSQPINHPTGIRVVRLFVRRDKSRSNLLYQLQVLSGAQVVFCCSTPASPVDAARQFAAKINVPCEVLKFGFSSSPSSVDMGTAR